MRKKKRSVRKIRNKTIICLILVWLAVLLINLYYSFPTGFAVKGAGTVSFYVKPPSVPPIISNVTSAATNSTANIMWATNENTNSSVYYGMNASDLGGIASLSGWRMLHNITLTNLQNTTKYFYQAGSCNASGNCAWTAIKNFTTLQNPNSPPAINGTIPDQTKTEDYGEWTLNLTPYKTDPDNNLANVTFSFIGYNSSILTIFINMTTNIMTFHTLNDLNGNTTFTIILSDSGGLTARQNITVFITPVNDAPVIAFIPDKQLDEDENPEDNWADMLSYASDIETNNTLLTYSISGQTNALLINCSIVSNRYINCSNPAPDSHGISMIYVNASDSELASQRSFTITVISVNDAPVISGIPNITLTEDAAFQLDISQYVSDIDNDDSSLMITANSPYATANGQTILFNYPDGITSDAIKITASDSSLSSYQIIYADITPVNDVPTTPGIAIYPAEVNAGSQITCNVTVKSIDPDSPVNYSFIWLLNNVFIEAVNTSLTYNTLSRTVFGSQKWTCNVSAYDGINASYPASVSVTVGNSAPTSPVADLAPNNPNTDSQLLCNIVVNSTDADMDIISYVYEWRKDNILQPMLAGRSIGPGNTTKDETWSCAARAYDEKSYSDAVMDRVMIVNSAPNITAYYPASQTIATNEGNHQVFNITKHDADGNDISVKWYKNGLVVGSNSAYNFTTDLTSAGTHIVKAVISDGKLTSEKTWALIVNNVNRNPTMPQIADQVAYIGQKFSLGIYAADPDTDDALTYYDNTTLFTIDRITGLISFVPKKSYIGNHSVKITVLDGKSGYNLSSFNIVIKPVNNPPVLAPIISLTAKTNKEFSYKVSAYDPDNDIITYSINSTLIAIDSATGIINFTPLTEENISLSLIATDVNGASDEEIIIIHVLASNRPPAITSRYPAGNVSISEPDSITYRITASDPDGTAPSIKWYLSKNNVNNIDSPNNLVSTQNNYTFSSNYSSERAYNVKAVISDGEFNSSVSWTLAVANTNRAPSIAPIPMQTTVEDIPFSYKIAASDSDTSIDVNPDVLVFSDNTDLFNITMLGGDVSFTPAGSQTGMHTINISVADGHGGRSSAAMRLNITPVNDAPVLNKIGSKTLLENIAFSHQANASDEENDALTYSDNTGLFDINSSTGLINFTPTYLDSGTYSVRISVSDSSGAGDYEDVSFIVLDTNRAPAIFSRSPANAEVAMKEDNTTTFSISKTDPDGTLPSVKWYKNGRLINGEAKGEASDSYSFKGNFSDEWTNAGSYSITVIVTDGILNDTSSWNLSVERTRDADKDSIPDYRDNCPVIFNPGQIDLDSNSIGDVCESDIDGDDVDDLYDYIIGNKHLIETNVDNIGVAVNDETDLDKEINETQPIKIMETKYNVTTGEAVVRPLIEFNYTLNETSLLYMQNMTVKKQTDSSVGSIVVSGIDLTLQNKTKTVYVDNLLATSSSVCVKDTQTASISEISYECNADSEVYLRCPGTNGTYACEAVDSKFKVSGIMHSAIQQVCTESWSCLSWGACSESSQSCNAWIDANSCGTEHIKPASQTRSCSSGEAGEVTQAVSGGSFSCISDWTCTDWSGCIESRQTRVCAKHIPFCSASEQKPEESRACEAPRLESPAEISENLSGRFGINLSIRKELAAGENLSAVIWLTNPGAGKVNVLVNYQINDSSGKIAYEENEVISVEMQKKYKKIIPLAGLESGQYTITITAYQGQRQPAQATDTFTISERKPTKAQKAKEFIEEKLNIREIGQAFKENPALAVFLIFILFMLLICLIPAIRYFSGRSRKIKRKIQGKKQVKK